MSLFLEGDLEEIRKFKKLAEESGLKIRLFSEETGIKSIYFTDKEIKTDPSQINLEEYPLRTIEILCHLYQETKRGIDVIPQIDLSDKLYIPRATVSYNTIKLEEDDIIEKIPIGRRSKGLKLKREISEEDYKVILKKLKEDKENY